MPTSYILAMKYSAAHLFTLLLVAGLSFWGGMEYQESTSLGISNTAKNEYSSKESESSPVLEDVLQTAPAIALKHVQLSSKLISSNQVEEDSLSTLDDVIQGASIEEVEEVLELFFDNNQLIEQIDDVKQFSMRLLEELSNKESSVDELSTAQIYFSLSADYPSTSQQYFSIDKKQKIYAHINTNSGLGLGDGKFFTRWKNKSTGEILLFKQKPVKPDSQKNWVSFTPDDAWLDGPYEVNFYQFNSTMNKLAGATFYVSVN